MENINIEKERARFEEILRSTGRRGIGDVLDLLAGNGFYEAPASVARHLNCRGGLLKHSLNVYDEAMMLRKGQCSLQKEMEELLPDDSVAIAALLHDVCKSDIYVPAMRSRKTVDGSWEKYRTWETDYSAFPAGHGEKSVFMLLQAGLELTDAEILAIRWHMAPWDTALQSTESMKCLELSRRLYPLVTLVSMADGLAACLLEETDGR